MTCTARILFALFIVFLCSGCQGKGAVINFNPHALPLESASSDSQYDPTLIIAVAPFKDRQPTHTQDGIGSRTHLGGGQTHFTAWNGNIGEGMAQLAVDYLKQRGWNASRASDGKNADVVLSGDVLTFTAQANSGVGFTKTTVELKVKFEAENANDRSTVRMVLGASASDTPVIFDPNDLATLINEVAKDLFNQLFRGLTLKNRAFHIGSN